MRPVENGHANQFRHLVIGSSPGCTAVHSAACACDRSADRTARRPSGRAANVLTALVPGLVAATIWLLYFQAQPHWLADPDAQDYAQIGRQIVAGRGPTTRFMPWNGLDFLRTRVEHGTPTSSATSALTSGIQQDRPPLSWPGITRVPLTPGLMALSFGAFGVSDESVHLPAALGYVLAAVGAGLLAALAYGPLAGLIAGLAAASLPQLVNYSLTGLTEPLLGALLLWTLAGVVAGRPLLAGLCLGLAILNRYDSAALALPIVALWLPPGPGRWGAISRFGLGAIVVVLPWSAYLTAVAGSPVFNLQPASIVAQASGIGGLGWYFPHYLPPFEGMLRDPSRAFYGSLGELAATPNLLRKLVGWPLLLAGALACLLDSAWMAYTIQRFSRGHQTIDGGPVDAAGPCATCDPDPRQNRSPALGPDIGRAWPQTSVERWFSHGFSPWDGSSDRPLPGGRLGVFLLLAVLLKALTVSALGLNLVRHFEPLVPLLLVVVAGEAARLLGLVTWLAIRRLPELPAVRLAAGIQTIGSLMVAAVLILPSLRTISPLLVPPSTPPGPPARAGEVEARPEYLVRLAELVEPDAVVASNVPWSVAWQADRRAVPLPPTVDETAELERRFGLTIDAIYVAGQVKIADAPTSWKQWDELRQRGTPPPGYRLAESFGNGGRLFVRER
ncbi:MAG: glycosyltransferase family 39 protein [Chloroflexi bacterium]|nr:glycosyltransferase family 39 protein [Chloroflexota bacterium]